KSRPLRVLCIDHEGGYGGSSRSLYQMIEAMDRSNMTLMVWCGRLGPIQERYARLGISVRVIDSLPSATTLHRLSRTLLGFSRCIFQLALNKKLRAELREFEGYDVIHFNHPNLFLLAAWIRHQTAAAQILHVRTVSENLYEGTPEFWLARAINKRTCRWLARWQTRCLSISIDQFVFITSNEQDAFSRLGGRADGPVIHNISVPLTTDPLPIPRIPANGQLIVACLENYRWSRGTDRLVEIADCLNARGRDDILFVVAGDMAFPRAQRRGHGVGWAGCKDLIEYVQRAGLEHYFLFLGHVAEPENVLAAADLLISVPRRAGPWGRNIIEAMAMGRPVLALGTWDGFIRSNENGLLHEKFDAALIAESLCILADDRARLGTLATAARHHIESCCDGPTNAKQLVALWRKAANKNCNTEPDVNSASEKWPHPAGIRTDLEG
ncbi:MAG: glycosyltransferase family 4 protein, partial [Proteobacteria bacterium]|nr:glycosyltransferase family 4 protein [Pseudomonadota bacterium]